METAEIARKALEILDRDGWAKGTFGQFTVDADGNAILYGPHCIGGAWTIAQGTGCWIIEENGSYRELWEMVAAMFPDWDYREYRKYISPLAPDSPVNRIVAWNDHFAAEDDVRAVLEKLAVSDAFHSGQE